MIASGQLSLLPRGSYVAVPGQSLVAAVNCRQVPSKRWQATYVGPDLQRHAAPVTFASKMDAEVWLGRERNVVASGEWVAPRRRAEIEARLAPPTFPAEGDPEHGSGR